MVETLWRLPTRRRTNRRPGLSCAQQGCRCCRKPGHGPGSRGALLVQVTYTGSYPILERYLRPLRRSDAATLVQVLRNRRRPVRQVTAWITGRPGRLESLEEASLRSAKAKEFRVSGRSPGLF